MRKRPVFVGTATSDVRVVNGEDQSTLKIERALEGDAVSRIMILIGGAGRKLARASQDVSALEDPRRAAPAKPAR